MERTDGWDLGDQILELGSDATTEVVLALIPRRAAWKGSGTKGGKGKKGHKGDRGDKGKGKGKLKYRTLDDKAICFAYNNQGESCDGQCGRAHVCRKCLGPHPMFSCGSKGEPKREDQ